MSIGGIFVYIKHFRWSVRRRGKRNAIALRQKQSIFPREFRDYRNKVLRGHDSWLPVKLGDRGHIVMSLFFFDVHTHKHSHTCKGNESHTWQFKDGKSLPTRIRRSPPCSPRTWKQQIGRRAPERQQNAPEIVGDCRPWPLGLRSRHTPPNKTSALILISAEWRRQILKESNYTAGKREHHKIYTESISGKQR